MHVCVVLSPPPLDPLQHEALGQWGEPQTQTSHSCYSSIHILSTPSYFCSAYLTRCHRPVELRISCCQIAGKDGCNWWLWVKAESDGRKWWMQVTTAGSIFIGTTSCCRLAASKLWHVPPKRQNSRSHNQIYRTSKSQINLLKVPN